MRTTLLAFAIAISGMSGNLQAAPRHHHPVVHSSIHKVRKGETAARIARENGITVAELATLNPRINLGRLAKGTPLRVAPERQAAALPLPGRLRTAPPRARNANPAAPVPPLPETPALGPGSLVHLERILPFQGLTPAPAGVVSAIRHPGEPSAASTPSLAGLRKVLPPVEEQGAEDQPDETLALPAATGSTEFEPADRDDLDLLWPVETRTISSAWGPRVRTRVVRVRVARRNKRVTRKFMGSHKGVDLSAPMGTSIFAAMDGQVVASGRQKDYGNYVAVDHGNGVVTLYAHCNRNFVEAGEIVRRGQKIAEIGRTGNATGPHLHFELRLDGIPQNPLPKMNDAEEIPAELMAQNRAAVPPSSRH